MGERSKDGVVFQTACYYVVALLKRALQQYVEGFRAVLGEDNSLGGGAAEMLRYGFAAGLYDAQAGQRKPMRSSAWVGAQLGGGLYCGQDGLRFCAARRGIVKINHIRTFLC